MPFYEVIIMNKMLNKKFSISDDDLRQFDLGILPLNIVFFLVSDNRGFRHCRHEP